VSQDPPPNPPDFLPPVSAFQGPVGELIAQQMLLPPPRPGLLALLDRFEILRVLGGGGMGIVLLARDGLTGQNVAVKLIRSDLVTNQNVVHRFLKEAGHLKRLRHANVVTVFEISTRPEGPYFVMPYFEQGSLAGRIRPGQPLDGETILDIAAQVADGLSFAHRSGIIHRDLKPANILLAPDGHACLADFGLARTFFNDSLVDVENRNLEGTAPYMSPAVAAGEAEDTRCDIYSFGAVLYEMLTGQPPYKGRGTKEILARIIAGPPQPVTALNPRADAGLVRVAEGCLARELRDRYADMRDVLNDLQRLKENLPAVGPRGFESTPGAPPAGKPGAGKLILAGAALVAVIALIWQLASGPAPAPTPAAVPLPTNAAVIPTPPAHPVSPIPTAPVLPTNPPVWSLTTLAGQIGVGGYVDGTVDETQFRLPNALAANHAGDLFVADTANNMIRRIAANGVVSPLAGIPESHGGADGAGSDARFWAPFGLAADRAGTIYVADTANNTIRKITADGVVSTLAGVAGRPGNADGAGMNARFRNPWGVAVDAAGNVYVADMSNHTIRKITPDGRVSTLAGQAGTAGSMDGIGAGAQFNSPVAVAVDTAGNVYVSDSANECIRKITPAGVVSTLAGLPGQAGSADGTGPNARFLNPQGLAVDDRGNLFVADMGNNTVREISPAGAVTTLAGLAGVGGTTDGIGGAARLNHPGGVALDGSGNVYVADSNNHAIRKLVFAIVPR